MPTNGSIRAAEPASYERAALPQLELQRRHATRSGPLTPPRSRAALFFCKQPASRGLPFGCRRVPPLVTARGRFRLFTRLGAAPGGTALPIRAVSQAEGRGFDPRRPLLEGPGNGAFLLP